MAAGRRNLLLCLDAFGTLFSPRDTVVRQYARVARQCGLGDVDEAQLATHMAAALRRERALHPNYGRATGLGATQWWTNVIQGTFAPLVPEERLPPALVPALLRRFASAEGYEPQPDLVAALRALRRPDPRHALGEVVVGVVTNSDDRVPGILSSMGLRVSPLRYGADHRRRGDDDDDDAYDVDFHCMSYDVGCEKPDARMFRAAESMLADLLAARGDASSSSSSSRSWCKVFVGDEHAKDVVGAAAAGWHPILLDADAPASPASAVAPPRLEDGPPGESLADAFRRHPVVRVSSVRSLALWLAGPQWASSRGGTRS